MLFRISYVGTQSHHLLASHDSNAGNAQTCDEIGQIFNNDPTGVLNGAGCGPVGADAEYQIPTTYADGSHVIVPTYAPPTQPFKVPASTCTGLPLPYNAGAGGNCIPGGTNLATSPATANGITFVGTRPFSSPNCQPLSAGAVGCPADGVPVFSNIFAEDTIANSNYNALQISVEKSYTHGLLFQASYTFSKAIDQGASFEQQLNPLNFNATRGLSLLSAKNRFVFSPVWDLPIPKQEGVAGKFANGWQVSAIITYQSGFPIRIEDQNDGELQSSFFFEDANTPTVDGKIQFVNPKKKWWRLFQLDNFTDPTPSVTNSPPWASLETCRILFAAGPDQQHRLRGLQKDARSMNDGTRSSERSSTICSITPNFPIRTEISPMAFRPTGPSVRVIEDAGRSSGTAVRFEVFVLRFISRIANEGASRLAPRFVVFAGHFRFKVDDP